jgi:hypothetical protein
VLGSRSVCLVLLALAGPACGSRTPAGARPSAAAPPDAGADGGGGAAGAGDQDRADAEWKLDEEAEDEDVSPLDAGLAEIGVASCEAVVARILRCPGVPEASKRQMAAASREWREAARRSPEARQKLAATCLEMARMTEEMLLEAGC